jgi:hypothetical protein
MKTPQEWWCEYYDSESHDAKRTFCDIVRAIRAEQRQDTWERVNKALNPKGIGLLVDVTAIRAAILGEPRFEPGQLVRFKYGSLGMWPYRKGREAVEYLEPVLDIHGNPVYLEAPDGT